MGVLFFGLTLDDVMRSCARVVRVGLIGAWLRGGCLDGGCAAWRFSRVSRLLLWVWGCSRCVRAAATGELFSCCACWLPLVLPCFMLLGVWEAPDRWDVVGRVVGLCCCLLLRVAFLVYIEGVRGGVALLVWLRCGVVVVSKRAVIPSFAHFFDCSGVGVERDVAGIVGCQRRE